MANIAEEPGRTFANPDDFDTQVREYVKLKASIDHLEARQKLLREKLIEKLDLEGYEDDKGNVQFELPTQIEGVARLEKQRRASRTLNEPLAEQIITDLGLFDEIFEMKPVLNEDALMAAFYEEKITEEQLDLMFPIKVTWALRTVRK